MGSRRYCLNWPVHIHIAWFYIEKGSGTWQKNWELHIDFLEDHITGKLHKTMLGEEGQFFFSSNDFAAFYFSVGVVWFILLMVAVSMLSTELKCIFVAIGEWLGAWAYLLAPVLGIAMAFFVTPENFGKRAAAH